MGGEGLFFNRRIAVGQWYSDLRHTLYYARAREWTDT